MTKNTTRDIHEKHTKKIRNVTLAFCKEDVAQDSSVVEFGTQDESRAVCPAKSRTLKSRPESPSTTLGTSSASTGTSTTSTSI
jgi:hypothetical protein